MDEEDQKILEKDIFSYTKIINSNKYADSNSNTEALEKLVGALSLTNTKGEQSSEPKQVALVTKLQAEASHSKEEHASSEGQGGSPETCKPVTEEENKGNLASQNFSERLAIHRQLLDELDRGDFLPGQPVHQPEKFSKDPKSGFKLRRFDIPKRIYDAMERNDKQALNLKETIGPQNYVEFFQTLLWVEEAHQAIEMHRYDLSSVMLGKFDQGNCYTLFVPGLAEGRPSLMRGDRLFLRNSKRSTLYEGYIHDVRENDILIKLHENLHSLVMDGVRFDVSFCASRTPFRRSHHGIFQYREQSLMKDIVFPSPKHIACPKKPMIEVKPEMEKSNSHLVNRQLNKFQRKAVINVLKAECRPAPYIIFGPPGTGKTVTLVEAILQVYKHKPNFKILVCANSNAAADLCATRLLKSGVVPRDQLVRISAFYRMEKLIPPEIEDITVDMDTFCMLKYNQNRDIKIIVTTCIQSGALYDYTDKYDYVFIDEAGHANEAETLISIGLMAKEGCCVLAGDHKQLGPVVMSKIAEFSGLGTSMLERLSHRAVYLKQIRGQQVAYDARYLTKLIISYRCDPRVMVVNNKLFYDNELEFAVKTPEKWMELLKVESPLVFHAVTGRDRREYLNPSWFNPNEAIRTLTYVKRLYDAGLKAEQLGIITPYRRQIEKLQLLLDGAQLRRCKIATMEEFQGDEREIILISTVRTREKNIQFDQKFNLGFLFSPKRFNVAVSRAKWMVIVVGDPKILQRDSNWVEFMEKAHKFEDPADIKKV